MSFAKDGWLLPKWNSLLYKGTAVISKSGDYNIESMAYLKSSLWTESIPAEGDAFNFYFQKPSGGMHYYLKVN